MFLAKFMCTRSPFSRHMLYLYAATFLLVLPLLCHKWKFSWYYISPGDKLFRQEQTRQDNDERIYSAHKYIDMVESTKLHRMFDVTSGPYRNQTDIVISIVTVSRNRHKMDTYEPKYLTQVMWKYLELFHDIQTTGYPYSVKIFMCNVDMDPASYEEAKYLSKVIPLVNRYDKLSLSMLHPLEKEKQDYVFCMNSSLLYNPRYVFLVEDDALPHQDVFKVLQNTISVHLDGDLQRGVYVNKTTNKSIKKKSENSQPYTDSNGASVTEGTTQNENNIAYVKFYHPERLLGFISIEPERLLELTGLSFVFSTLLVFIYYNFVSQGNAMVSIHKMWFSFFIYSALVFVCIGRVNIIELRRAYSPYFYSYGPAPGCCTPAMLFPRDGAEKIANYLQNTECKKSFGKDLALDKYIKESAMRRYIVQPNVFTHIGMYSSLRSIVLDPFIV